MEKTLNTSSIAIKNFYSDKLYLQCVTNELINKILGNKKLKISYFETCRIDSEFITEGMIVEYGEEVYIIDDGYGYISKYIPSLDNHDNAYILSRFNWPGDNIKASRAGLVSDYLLTGFNINTSEYLEDPKNSQNTDFYHVMKLRFLFSNPDFRLNDEVTEEQFLDWTYKQPEFKIIVEEPNNEWFKDNPTSIEDTKVDLSRIEKQLEDIDQVQTIKDVTLNQVHYTGSKEDLDALAKDNILTLNGANPMEDIPLIVDVSGSSEDTIRVFKEFDLGQNEWNIDYVYSFRYGIGSYLLKLKTDTFGRVECLLMVLRGTQWVNVQLNDLLLDVRSDSKKSKSVVIETYKKEIMKFIDFFEVN